MARKNQLLTVTKDTQIHMSSVYKRNQSGAKEKGVQRHFSYVIQGVMISAALVGSLVFAGGQAQAASVEPVPMPSPSIQMTAHPEAQLQRQEQALVSNLKMATRVVQTAMKTGQLDSFVFDNVLKRVELIGTSLDANGVKDTESLASALDATAEVLREMRTEGVGAEILAKRDASLQAVEAMQTKLQAYIQSGEPHQVLLGSKTFGRALAGNTQGIRVVIDGQPQNFTQAPISMNGTTMVPMRDIFQALGATVQFDSGSQTVTAMKGDTGVILTIGKDTALLNGVTVKLEQKAQSIKGVTMVPLRFVSQALGANVKWDAGSMTVTITGDGSGSGPVTGGATSPDYGAGRPIPAKPAPTKGQTVNGIKVKYGNHTYGVDTQAEYNAAMKIVETAKSKAPSLSSSGYTMEYLNGARWDGDRGNLEDVRNSELYLVEKKYGDLVNNGVPKETIIRLIQAQSIAGSLVQGKKDLGDSKSAYSFYHTLVKGITDCDATAHTISAVYDSYGFSSSVYYKPGHASPFIKVNGKVYDGLSLKYTGQPSSNLKALSSFQ